MVLDTVENAARYRGMHRAVDRALAVLATTPWLELEDGRHELAEGVHALLSAYTTAEPEGERYECHREYADVQLLLQGAEMIYWASAADLQPAGEYDPAGDILYFQEPEAGSVAVAPVQVRPGLFLLLYPTDAHKPGRIWSTSQRVRKAVLKIRL